jgi:hypothetical protein
MYQHPYIKQPTKLEPGCIVEHKLLPGVGLAVVSGPHQGVTGEVYRVILPGGRVEKVKRGNLRI